METFTPTAPALAPAGKTGKHENLENNEQLEHFENMETWKAWKTMTLKIGNIWKTKKAWKTYTNDETEHETLRTQWFGHAWITKRYIHIGLGTHSPPNVTYATVWAIMAYHTLRTQRFVEPWVSKPLCTYELVGCVCPNRISRSIW